MLKVIDNLMPEKFVGEYHDMHMRTFPWYFNNWTILPGRERNFKCDLTQIDVGQFVHIFWNDNNENSDYAKVPLEILKKLVDKHKLKFDGIGRIKSNLTYRKYRDNKTLQPVHNDMDEKNEFVSLIYYTHDCDGDTIFFKKNGDVKKRIKPKRNRIVMFNSDTPHAGQNPKEYEYRIVTNFVLKV